MGIPILSPGQVRASSNTADIEAHPGRRLAMERLQTLASHLTGHPSAKSMSKSPDDVVITCAVRTPICRAKKGSLRNSHPEDLLSAVLSGLLTRAPISPSIIEDIAVGTVLAAGGGATVSRMAALHAGIPHTVPISTVNRQCASGLQSVAVIANAIRCGSIGVGVAAGVESMTMNYGAQAMPASISENVRQCQEAEECLMPMGITSENVAEKHAIPRMKQDQFSLMSHQKAAAAQKSGFFAEEIVPVASHHDDGTETIITLDDGIRADVTLEALSKLKPAFKDNGTTTAGNSSQVSDGAAAVLLMTRRRAQELQLPILARYIDMAVVGVPPSIMGIGPAVAIPAVLARTGLAISDISIFEINEAFASQAVYCIEKLNIDPKKVNPKGGAIALGHPLGATGSRQIATLLPELKRTRGRFGIVSMCIGTGMGAAAVIENEQ